jgi:hypothetical protein
MRTLIVIPIIRAEKDVASLLGERFKSADEVWSGIRSMIAELALPYANVRLYQDALPLCEKEAELVKELAARGSMNHQFLVELMGQGARLMGTEDPHLLLEEYRLLQAASGGGKQGPGNAREGQSQSLSADRERFIAARINATLADSEVGLLFLDPAHSVEPFLDADILVRRLLPSLPDRPSKAEPTGEPGPRRPIAELHDQ